MSEKITAPILKKGQYTSTTIYTGDSKIEAEFIYNYIKNFQDNNIPMPLGKGGNKAVKIELDDVTLKTKDDYENDIVSFKVEFRGVIV